MEGGFLRRRFRRVGIFAAVTAGFAVAAAPALAADYYVDRDVADTGPDLCTQAQPCDQVSDAFALADANDGSADTVHVGRSNGAYGAVTVPNTPLTLLGGEFDGGGPPATVSLIDGSSGAGVIFDASSFARTLDGFTIRGGAAFDRCAIEDQGSIK